MSDSKNHGLVILFTGLSGAGKTTLAKHLSAHIQENLKRIVSILDGDEVRTWLSEGLGFSEADRKKNILRVGKVAVEIAKHGGVVICAIIAPYEIARREMREMTRDHAHFVEVYVYAPKKVVQKRDVKGLYARSKKDKNLKLSGFGDVYEEPKNPDLIIDTHKHSIKSSIEKIIKYLNKNILGSR